MACNSALLLLVGLVDQPPRVGMMHKYSHTYMQHHDKVLLLFKAQYYLKHNAVYKELIGDPQATPLRQLLSYVPVNLNIKLKYSF